MLFQFVNYGQIKYYHCHCHCDIFETCSKFSPFQFWDSKPFWCIPLIMPVRTRESPRSRLTAIQSWTRVVHAICVGVRLLQLRPFHIYDLQVIVLWQIALQIVTPNFLSYLFTTYTPPPTSKPAQLCISKSFMVGVN